MDFTQRIANDRISFDTQRKLIATGNYFLLFKLSKFTQNRGAQVNDPQSSLNSYRTKISRKGIQ